MIHLCGSEVEPMMCRGCALCQALVYHIGAQHNAPSAMSNSPSYKRHLTRCGTDQIVDGSLHHLQFVSDTCHPNCPGIPEGSLDSQCSPSVANQSSMRWWWEGVRWVSVQIHALYEFVIHFSRYWTGWWAKSSVTWWIFEPVVSSAMACHLDFVHLTKRSNVSMKIRIHCRNRMTSPCYCSNVPSRLVTHNRRSHS